MTPAIYMLAHRFDAPLIGEDLASARERPLALVRGTSNRILVVVRFRGQHTQDRAHVRYSDSQLYIIHRDHVHGPAKLPSFQPGQSGAAVASVQLGARGLDGIAPLVLEATAELRQYLVDHILVVQRFRQQATGDRREVLWQGHTARHRRREEHEPHPDESGTVARVRSARDTQRLVHFSGLHIAKEPPPLSEV